MNKIFPFILYSFQKLALTRTLYIIRHAHAWDLSTGQRDIERELTSDGLKTAIKAGEWLKSHAHQPSVIITSAAIRAKSTAWLIAERLTYPHERIIVKDDLYEAPVRTMLQSVNSLQNSWEHVVLVGHNPTIHYFAEYVTGDNITSVSPGTICSITFELEDWGMVSEKTGQLSDVVEPR